ncbi:MAG: PKD domain-containing protein [Bacteroidales bacterium]|nr:PKD domain-containing protein [Bacteroidales bacterium]MBN2756971.1 PKD domain-containing protein [Bacteroidales bacterium]
MKKNYFFLLISIFVLSLFPKSLIGQRTCAAHEHMLEQHAKSPKMQQKAQELEDYTKLFVKNFSANKASNTRTIPVNVIVIYSNTQQNISDAQIQSQISVLNKDYGGINTDLSGVPSEFTGVTSSGTGIQFVLANIERHSNSKSEWGYQDAMKIAYPPTSPSTTLNMWICNIGGGILGYAQFPGGAASTDGVVFSPLYCGSSDYGSTFYLDAPFDKGRTATHEIGHYLNLRHIWGDGNCTATDYVDDTPSAESEYYGCPTYPQNSCNSNDMFMNYMDYVDDQCMFMFSDGQEARMWACLNTTRSELGTSSGNIDPTADANGPYTGDTGIAINFSSNGSSDSDGTIASYSWNFGDGSTSTSANPSHTYSADGNYNVSLTVTDNQGATDVDNTTAVIGENACSGVSACDGAIKLTLLTDKYGSETSWTLKNSSGTTVQSGSGYSNSTTYNINWNLTEGQYTFTINDSYGDGICCAYGSGSYKLTDGCNATLVAGGAFGSSESTIFCTGTTENNAPVAEANGPYSAYKGVAISFSSAGTADSDGTISSYSWNFGDGTTSTSANPSHSYSSVGNYTATLTVTDNAGATDSDQASVSITEAPSCINVNLTIKLDNYPEETSWTLKTSTGSTVASGGTYGNMADGSIVTSSNCLAVGCYTFTINDTYGDGICCKYGSGSYNLVDASGTVLASGGTFIKTQATNFCLGSGRNSAGNVSQEMDIEDSRIYPNPTDDFINVKVAEGHIIYAILLLLMEKLLKLK